MPDKIYVPTVALNDHQKRIDNHKSSITLIEVILSLVNVFFTLAAAMDISDYALSMITKQKLQKNIAIGDMVVFLSAMDFMVILFIFICILILLKYRFLVATSARGWGFLPDRREFMIFDNPGDLEEKIKKYSDDFVKAHRAVTKLWRLLLIISFVAAVQMSLTLPHEIIGTSLVFFISIIANALLNIWLQMVFSSMNVGISKAVKVEEK